MTRLRDVASRAGVSVATTSRVLTGSSNVSDALRQRVLAAVAELNYSPDGVARSMSIRRTSLLGLVVADITSPFFAHVARGVEDIGRRKGYSVVLCNTDDNVDKERAYLGALREKRVDGILLAVVSGDVAHVRRLADAGAKLVLLDRVIPQLDLPFVQVDNVGGVRQAMEYLLGLGHRRIALVVGDPAIATAHQRLEGYEAALAAAGVPLDPDLLVPTGFTEHGGYEAALRIWALTPRPTAMISGSDVTTIGVLSALRARGARIPADVSVVGFDDAPLFPLLAPPLTVVAQPIYDLGRRACELLLRMVTDGAELTREESRVQLPTRLIIRESCGPVPVE